MSFHYKTVAFRPDADNVTALQFDQTAGKIIQDNFLFEHLLIKDSLIAQLQMKYTYSIAIAWS